MKLLHYYIIATFLLLGCKTEEPLNAPIVSTTPATEIGINNATLNGEVTNEGFSSTTERGFVYSDKNPNPSVSDTKVQTGFGKGTFKVYIDKLKSNNLYYFKAYATNTKGTSYGPILAFKTLEVPTVTSKTGRIWMDRNLGATKVASSLNDIASYGDYFQWGRLADGHEKRNSGLINQLSITDVPGHGLFIIFSPTYLWNNYDWRFNHNDNFWQGVNSLNNVCPNGFRLPTQNEWIEEIKTWNSNDNNGALNSQLKLPPAGRRSAFDGTFELNTNAGFYWSSTVTPGAYSKNIIFGWSGGVTDFESSRAVGYCVRCIKD
jgi:uncharacterized protein (TIGR02145 family)